MNHEHMKMSQYTTAYTIIEYYRVVLPKNTSSEVLHPMMLSSLSECQAGPPAACQASPASTSYPLLLLLQPVRVQPAPSTLLTTHHYYTAHYDLQTADC